MPSAPPSARDRLLARVVEHLLAGGLGDASLRELAAAVGSSHRMLSYHFGSRDGLLAAVVEEVERRQLEALRDLGRRGSLRSTALAMHRRLSDPALAPLERLFFELYARGLRGDPAAAPLMAEGIATWLEATAALLRGFGLPARQARAEATLSLAVARGLLLDLLATGDRRRNDAAMRLHVAGVLARLDATHERGQAPSMRMRGVRPR